MCPNQAEVDFMSGTIFRLTEGTTFQFPGETFALPNSDNVKRTLFCDSAGDRNSTAAQITTATSASCPQLRFGSKLIFYPGIEYSRRSCRDRGGRRGQ